MSDEFTVEGVVAPLRHLSAVQMERDELRARVEWEEKRYTKLATELARLRARLEEYDAAWRGEATAAAHSFAKLEAQRAYNKEIG